MMHKDARLEATVDPLCLGICEPWLRSILVDPIGKGALLDVTEGLMSDVGHLYPLCGSIYDLRRTCWAPTSTYLVWKEGQRAYEDWFTGGESFNGVTYRDQIATMSAVYEQIELRGRICDVGGHQGRLRVHLASAGEYVSCDPCVNVFAPLQNPVEGLVDLLPFLLTPVNFIACHAEHLPFDGRSFDTVHMRSVIDHLFDPALALCEARRVLKADGRLILGTYVQGGHSGSVSLSRRGKNALHKGLASVGMRRFVDMHIWHPTYAELVALVHTCGFRVINTVWQAGHADHVCYIEAAPANHHSASASGGQSGAIR